MIDRNDVLVNGVVYVRYVEVFLLRDLDILKVLYSIIRNVTKEAIVYELEGKFLRFKLLAKGLDDIRNLSLLFKGLPFLTAIGK